MAAVGVGFQFGMASDRRIMTANLALSLTFALVMMLAVDLGEPESDDRIVSELECGVVRSGGNP